MRTSGIAKFADLLQEKTLSAKRVDDGLEIFGVTTDEIGKLAYGAGFPILELTNRHASLEDVFLELTEGSEEFKAHDQKDGKS